MNGIQKKLALVGGGLAVGLHFSGIFGGSDQKQIEALLDRIEVTGELEEPLGSIAMASRLKAIEAELTSDVVLQIAGNEDSEPRTLGPLKDLKPLIFAGARHFKQVSMFRRAEQIRVNGNTQASANFEVVVEGEQEANLFFRELFYLELQFEKAEAEWKIQKALVKRITPDEG